MFGPVDQTLMAVKSSPSVLVGANDFAAGAGAQGPIRVTVDGVLDELDRAIGESEVGAAGMQAAEAPLPDIQTGGDIDPVRRHDGDCKASPDQSPRLIGRCIEPRD